ncbi:SpoIID/LytB domain-containing protein [Bacillus piscicola]|uniref:SpoIID/LytB domain-containing protein n=1 Tax=Bacillus piscicola TaxID=1632684 RepID=UPI001F092C19|nr:SpoIID/LytB domain-containing protein [Bacillus piscicola]
MHKKLTGLLVAVCLLVLMAANVEAAAPNDLYDEPITVKLVPSVNFDATLYGSYELIDLKDQEKIKIGNNVQFRHASDKVVVKLSGDKSVSSTQGYILQESPVSSRNYVSLTSVLRAGTDFKQTDYRGSFVIKPSAKNNQDDKTDRLQLFNVLGIEDYLKGVVPKEMSASWPKEALKAQAVAARNYAKVNMDANTFLFDTVKHQVYHGRSGEAGRSNEAVTETKGTYAVYNGALIYAYFHASSGGYTDNSENVWSGKVPYIRAVKDPYDLHNANPNTNWTATVTRDEADKAIFPEKEWELARLEVIEKSKAGRVQKIRATAIHSTTGKERVKILPDGASPDSLRWALGTTLKSNIFDMKERGANAVSVKMGDGSVKSYNSAIGMKMRQKDGTDNAISYENLAVRTPTGIQYANTAPASYTFTGKGWGHGLGMSQWGAYKMAKDGKSYREILKHYYTGIDIVKR